MEADVKRALTALRRERAGADEAGARSWIDERGGRRAGMCWMCRAAIRRRGDYPGDGANNSCGWSSPLSWCRPSEVNGFP